MIALTQEHNINCWRKDYIGNIYDLNQRDDGLAWKFEF